MTWMADPAICATCGGDSIVIDSRLSKYGLRRRRQCREEDCQSRWTTRELPESSLESFYQLLKNLDARDVLAAEAKALEAKMRQLVAATDETP